MKVKNIVIALLVSILLFEISLKTGPADYRLVVATLAIFGFVMAGLEEIDRESELRKKIKFEIIAMKNKKRVLKNCDLIMEEKKKRNDSEEKQSKE